MTLRSFSLSFMLALAVLGAVLSRSRADGAFPDSLGILLPEDQPHRIIAVTNFGLVLSEDDGATWRFVCEEAIGLLATLYQLGPPPDDRLFAVTADGLMLSIDNACSWDPAQGSVGSASDVFPDPNDPQHVLVVAKSEADAGIDSVRAVFESRDGGKTFGALEYGTPPGGYVEGVEIARGDSADVYLALYLTDPSMRAQIVRSKDGGAHWQGHDVTSSIEGAVARIIAVDPMNVNKLYLRVLENGPTERFALYDDSQMQAQVTLTTQHPITAFLLRSDGAVIVGTSKEGSFISKNGGKAFDPWPNAPHLRGLGERGGMLYAVADNTMDGYAVGVSKDQGASWQPLLRFEQIKGPLDCGNLPSRCAAPWTTLLATLAKPSSLEPFLDGGTVPNENTPGSSGCSCSLAPVHASPSGWAELGLLAGTPVCCLRFRRSRSRARVSKDWASS